MTRASSTENARVAHCTLLYQRPRSFEIQNLAYNYAQHLFCDLVFEKHERFEFSKSEILTFQNCISYTETIINQSELIINFVKA